jgi:two-component system, NarL family, response regulator
MDLCLPDANGVVAIRRIREEFCSARILVLSINESEEDIYQSVLAGAMGYLPKSVEPHDLLRAIRSLSSGERFFPPQLPPEWRNEKVDQVSRQGSKKLSNCWWRA